MDELMSRVNNLQKQNSIILSQLGDVARQLNVAFGENQILRSELRETGGANNGTPRGTPRLTPTAAHSQQVVQHPLENGHR
ncbi:hypothetical protein CEUSTIGMA_g8959.t1 [Chlamydomonas eustigma]|uniref:Uncharacterized protein n=1 Tax=Chlamydomonas eustigma TaxID=1157962 RepID=A0A250XEP9_9CHLO|nr:hypothetical protein CEUSTIGMA_g8959.t1 [Chlamydomonas eustigma]|eukprot:GAX81531.1 hypothetical protein CEUSTIGMA_g8959.t1 [Chlamydomonas eustigma]